MQNIQQINSLLIIFMKKYLNYFMKIIRFYNARRRKPIYPSSKMSGSPSVVGRCVGVVLVTQMFVQWGSRLLGDSEQSSHALFFIRRYSFTDRQQGSINKFSLPGFVMHHRILDSIVVQ